MDINCLNQMKMKRIVFFLPLLFLFFFVPFNSCSQHIAPKLTDTVFTKADSVINLNNHSKFVIELPSNIGSGYSWRFMDSSFNKILRLVNVEYIRPSPISEDEAASPTNRYHFEAIAVGTAYIRMANMRPFEKEIRDNQKLVFLVRIQ